MKRAIGKRDKLTARTKLIDVPDDLDDETVWRHHVHRPVVPWMNYILHFERRCATAVGPNDLYFGTKKNDRPVGGVCTISQGFTWRVASK